MSTLPSRPERSDLEVYFRQNDDRLINKWLHYFDVYERHFSRFRGRPVVMLEIGVSQGGSLRMWKEYFGADARIYAVDIDPRCKQFEEDGVEIFIGSQSDRKFLAEVRSRMPPPDIILDDGGHTMRQQIVSYEVLFDYIKSDGVYLCEDTHTSYWLKFGGGHRRRNTFIEYSKRLVDQLNAFHSEQSSLVVDEFTTSVDSVHFYDSIVVIEKRPRGAPATMATGKASFSHEVPVVGAARIVEGLKYRGVYAINKVLRFFRLGSFVWK